MIRTIPYTVAVAAILITGCASDASLFRTPDELAQRTVAPPTATLPARLTQDTEVRSSPHDISPVLHRLPTGTELLASEESTRGWRRVKTQDGKGGYVPAAAVEVTASAPAAATPAAEAAPTTSEPTTGTAQ